MGENWEISRHTREGGGRCHSKLLWLPYQITMVLHSKLLWSHRGWCHSKKLCIVKSLWHSNLLCIAFLVWLGPLGSSQNLTPGDAFFQLDTSLCWVGYVFSMWPQLVHKMCSVKRQQNPPNNSGGACLAGHPSLKQPWKNQKSHGEVLQQAWSKFSFRGKSECTLVPVFVPHYKKSLKMRKMWTASLKKPQNATELCLFHALAAPIPLM